MPLGIGPLTSQFLGEIQDPPHRLLADDTTSILEEQMRIQNPEQSIQQVGLTVVSNLLRSNGDPKVAMIAMMGQLLAAANAVNEEDNKE